MAVLMIWIEKNVSRTDMWKRVTTPKADAIAAERASEMTRFQLLCGLNYFLIIMCFKAILLCEDESC